MATSNRRIDIARIEREARRMRAETIASGARRAAGWVRGLIAVRGAGRHQPT